MTARKADTLWSVVPVTALALCVTLLAGGAAAQEGPAAQDYSWRNVEVGEGAASSSRRARTSSTWWATTSACT